MRRAQVIRATNIAGEQRGRAKPTNERRRDTPPSAAIMVQRLSVLRIMGLTRCSADGVRIDDVGLDCLVVDRDSGPVWRAISTRRASSRFPLRYPVMNRPYFSMSNCLDRRSGQTNNIGDDPVHAPTGGPSYESYQLPQNNFICIAPLTGDE